MYKEGVSTMKKKLNRCTMKTTVFRKSQTLLFLIVTVFLAIGIVTDAYSKQLKVKVLKACETCELPAALEPCSSVVFHQDQAAVWVPEKNVKIHAVSIPEQSEVTLYTDIEVSTAPEMYLPEGHIFRVKYAGPAIQRDPACEISFAGSNITNTNINFTPNWISVKKGTPIYVHMDVINWTPYPINPMTQDVYLYYTVGK